MDSLETRYALLKPYVTEYGPQDDAVRPAMLLFHGCGGMRPHVHAYAKAAAATGLRAYTVDSFAPRGWNRTFATSLICTGAVMQGYERSGDVLAMLWGLKQDPRTDMDKVMLTGFSHGGWSIMDLMTEPLKVQGEAKLQDPNPSLADQVKALFLVYPYINFPARSNTNSWLRTPRTFAVLAERDHLTPIKHARKVFEKVRTAGADVQTLELNATHAFDEEDNTGGIMAFSPQAMQASMDAMVTFAKDALAV